MNDDKKISELPFAPSLSLDDLLPVVHDGVTSKVTLRSLISEMQFQIPQPRIKIKRDMTGLDYYGHDQVIASWEGSDDKFLKFNPKFFLYRYRSAGLRTFRNKLTNVKDTVMMKRRFVHPSHHHGDDYERIVGNVVKGTRQFDGQQFATISGVPGPIPSRNTEWPVAIAPLVETHLDLGPWSYFRSSSMADEYVGIGPQDWPQFTQPWPRGAGSKKVRFIVFKVRIAIDNPDPDSNQPKLFGPFSETFILFPHKSTASWDNLRYFLGPEASPRLRRGV